MHDQLTVPGHVELYIPDLDNHVVIENEAGGVVIQASRDNFPANRKVSFIRRLAAEGYIPDRYEWFCEPAEDGLCGVKWIAQPDAPIGQTVLQGLRKLCTRRNAVYGSLFIVWLLFFIWAVRHMRHGLGV
jgi:hypothetical protein